MSHKYSLAEFCQGVNVITGRSDEGKSAFILKALTWAFYNKPLGFSFKSNFSDGKEATKVAVQFYDDKFIIRERNNKIDQYRLSEFDDPLKSLRGGIPDEVKSIINFQDYNIQGQHDTYYLLQQSSGEIAKILNEIAGLEDIDFFTSEIKKKISSIKNEQVFLSNQEEKLKNDIREFKDLPRMRDDVNRLERLLINREQLRNKRTGLYTIIPDLQKLEDEIEEINLWLEIDPLIQNLILYGRETQALIITRNGLKNIISEIAEIDKDIEFGNDQISIFEEFISLADEIRDCKKEAKKNNEVKEIISEIKILNSNIIRLDELIQEKEEEKKEIDICPITGEYCEVIVNRG